MVSSPFLRHVSADRLSWQQRLEAAMVALPAALGLAQIRLLGEWGSAARALGDLPTAVLRFEEALALARVAGERRLEAANLVRLGVAWHYQERLSEAEACFAEALRLTEREPAAWDYRDFALQHWGKLCVEQEAWERARRFFEEARVLRCHKGDAELLASTDEALQALALRQQAVDKREVSA